VIRFNKAPINPQYLYGMTTAAKPWQLDSWFSSDERLHNLYPAAVQPMAGKHWTPLNVARMAVQFLVPAAGARVLDIGSGVGKFCLSGAYYKPYAFFHGVEQRRELAGYAEMARNTLGLFNVSFSHGNFTQLNLRHYDHIYFFNSFYENLVGTDKIDDTIQYSPALFNYYNRYLYKQLDQMPAGTRVVTFHSLGEEMPSCYEMVQIEVEDSLKFYIKI